MSHGFLSMCATAEEKGGQTDRPAACSASQTDFVPQGRTEAGKKASSKSFAAVSWAGGFGVILRLIRSQSGQLCWLQT